MAIENSSKSERDSPGCASVRGRSVLFGLLGARWKFGHGLRICAIG